jgi:hypothetical protein
LYVKLRKRDLHGNAHGAVSFVCGSEGSLVTGSGFGSCPSTIYSKPGLKTIKSLTMFRAIFFILNCCKLNLKKLSIICKYGEYGTDHVQFIDYSALALCGAEDGAAR